MPVRSPSRSIRLAVTALVLVGLAGSAACDSIYYSTMKRFGVEKRDLLVKRVRDARKSQDEAKEEFANALEKFKSVIAVEDSTLEQKYERLSRELDRSEDKAKQVRDRIKAVRDVSEDLLKEWRKELDKYSDRRLRAESERELEQTRRRSDELLAAMDRVEQRLTPVLTPLRDRVLFLKHNLNARAMGALDNELLALRGNVDSLVAELQTSITEADAFIKEMEAGEGSGAS